MLLIPGFPSTAVGAIWDLWHLEKNVFIVYDSVNIITYIYTRDSLNGNN